MIECLITGCELWIPDENKTLHGDLHATHNCYIFNGVLTEKGEAAWSLRYNEPEAGRKVIVMPGHTYFDRRGVVVIEKDDAYLNARASDYVNKWSSS